MKTKEQTKDAELAVKELISKVVEGKKKDDSKKISIPFHTVSIK